MNDDIFQMLEEQGINDVCRQCDYYVKDVEVIPYPGKDIEMDVEECTCTEATECPRLGI